MIADRKAEHLEAAAGPGVLHAGPTGLDTVRLRHRALPGRDLRDVSLATTFLGTELDAPVMIGAMTGGTAEAIAINAALAGAAARHGLAMALGSGRALLQDPSRLDTYVGAVRPPLLLANLGAVGLEPDEAVRLLELTGADALSVHLNPIQEAVQPEGDPDFGDVLDRITATVTALDPVPVVAKEVGFGMDPEDIRALVAAGVAAVEVGGAGGTNWALVEGRRDPVTGAIAAAFADWGVPTARALATESSVPLVASGGIADGVAVAKCLALGADLAAIARPLLLAAQAGRTEAALEIILRQLRIAVWATGAPTSAALGAAQLA